MNKKQIKSLALASYNNDSLDNDRINSIVRKLTRSQLKQYITTLKNYENKRNVIITTPIASNYMQDFEKIFPDRNLIYKTDASLILGAKILNNDMIYEFSLKNSLNNIMSHITDDYD